MADATIPDKAVARSFWVTAPGRGEIRAAPVTAPGPDDVVVETVRSAISRGTESLVFQGRVPESQYAAMRCPFQDGDFPAPVKYGYASVGVAQDSGARVFCLYPHQDRYVAPAASVIAIPDDIPDDRAVLAANMETAVNAMWDAGPRIGDRIAVVGGGVVGCMVAALCGRLPGARVQLVDVNPNRAAVAAALGVCFAAPDEAAGTADIVFHASGASAGLTTALGLAGFEAPIIEMSWYGDRAVAAPLGEAFHAKRLSIRASQVGAVAASRRSRRTRRDRLTFAMGLLRDPMFDCLITGRSAFEHLPETMAGLASDPGDALCHVVTYS
ncbi:MAG: zinc-binding alcohol dehydrogenase [Rhodospirillaceae bacterium]|jgi:threonine dehydrogenase-like Zn-dependent dehydrogenase|nr:zinc-binding alcohol dehydrogenase [Rhodospirillaceae bacterium]